MHTIIRKLGNSAGIIVPVSIMKDLGLRIDQSVDLKSVDGCLVIQPLSRPRYKLAELLAEMGDEFPLVDAWDDAPAAGKELSW